MKCTHDNNIMAYRCHQPRWPPRLDKGVPNDDNDQQILQVLISIQPPWNPDREASLSTGQIDVENPDKKHRLSNTEPTATRKHHTQETTGCHCRERDSRRQES